jgi:hypothetical protein
LIVREISTQTRAVPFLTAVFGLVGKIGDEPMVRKWRPRASRQVLIGDQLKTAKALGSEVPPMLLGRDKHQCLLAILELPGHGRLWVKLRNTHREWMSSASPQTTDMR